MGEQLIDIVLLRIKKISEYSGLKISKMSRENLVRVGLMDPVRVFVKDEPHQKTKLAEKRVRLIHSVSLVDKLIEMVLVRHITKNEIRNWKTIPSKPGIGFDDESYQAMVSTIRSMNKPCDSDAKGWDMSVKEWMMRDEALITINLCDNPSNFWKKMVSNKALIEARSLFQFSDGTLMYPSYTGIVNSGKYKTSFSNSKMRVYLSQIVGSPYAIAAGDDCIEEYVDDAIQKYAILGIKIKAYKEIDQIFEFCSHVYTNVESYAINSDKMIMNFLHHDLGQPLQRRMLFMGLYAELGSRPDWQEIVERLRSIGLFDLEGGQIIDG